MAVENLYSQPTLVGTMQELPTYNPLGAGTTDRLFLIGHSDALELNDPYQVVSIQDAFNKLQADVSSPLLRSLLEAYYSGALDIWLIAAAPLSEYEPNIAQRTTPYYQTYNDRLATTYSLLESWDAPQIVCPIDAPYFDAKGVDFLTPLITHCSNSYSKTGSLRLGFMGTRGPVDDSAIAQMTTDPRLSNAGPDGKFVSVIVGEGLFNNKEIPLMYSGSLHVAAAAQLATFGMSKSLTYTKLFNVSNFVGRLTPAQLGSLANAKLNPVWKTSLGERGKSFEVVVLTDNTLGQTGTDFWSLVQVRLVMHVIEDVKRLGNRYLGTVGFGQLKSDLQKYFSDLVNRRIIKTYTLTVERDTIDRLTVLVDISVTPYFGVRQLTFSVLVGPGQ